MKQTAPPALTPAPESVGWALLREKTALLALLVLGTLILMALLGQVLIHFGVLDPDLVRLADKLRPPLSRASTENLRPDQVPAFGIYWLGTDELGRSVLVRLIAGSSVSLAVGLFSIGIATGMGLVLGCTAGFFGQSRLGPISVDAVILRSCDTVSCFPTLFLALTVIALLPASLWTLVLVIGFTSFMAPTRLVRAEVLALRNQDYIVAARALGCSEMRIVRRHLLPAVTAPLVVSATLGIAFAVLTESALSFLGFGIQPPNATWGNILSGARPYLFDAPWLFAAPGLAIFALVLAAHLVGDALQRELTRRGATEGPL